ncbi:uncharacterized protein MYCFIDRAFT_194936 [Pseudocercospora fijiensis CIRAD86]|uniref:Uncharacterized protein n=1 Tax=Pseudocercospora fijiensis (strain CIRAD86) TaxID=383855 RepID=M3A7J2_PSEFD|nr:uncharacterized protein MYCFIDRAFT_194936 [Pseudocercospora fijiensis CIRAD86]EME87054.1 hypothetical protein MYCFIDRAFT_194936 [Pseudocercospora fijiensis CIRAD86]
MKTYSGSEDRNSSLLGTSLQSEHSQKPGRSKDIFEAANRHPETGQPLQKKTGAAQKILESAAFKKIDEHVPSIRKVLRHINVTLPSAHERLEASPNDHTLSNKHPSSSQQNESQVKRIHLPRITPPSGPIPNSKVSPRPSTSSNRNRNRNLDLYFLTPLEREVHDILHRTGRVAIYKGLLCHPTTILLCHPSDVPSLQKIRSMTQRMESEDRHKLATTLETLIDQKQRYILNLLLWEREGLRITSSSIGTGIESPEYVKSSVRKNWRRPTSFEILGAGLTGVRESWIQKIKGEDDGEEGGRKGVEVKPFTIFEVKGHEGEEVPRLKGLRGGGDDGNERLKIPGSRSAKAYVRLALGSTSREEKLGDEERVPRIMWWLAGGRVSLKKKAPTAGELRRRRKAEVENRKEVGLLGTLLGVRERTGEAAAVEDSGDEAAEEIGQVEEVISKESKAKDGADESSSQAEGNTSEAPQAKSTEDTSGEEISKAAEPAVKT